MVQSTVDALTMMDVVGVSVLVEGPAGRVEQGTVVGFLLGSS